MFFSRLTFKLNIKHVTLILAYNMVIGRFGGAATNRICVQSFDGKLSFYDGEVLTLVFRLENVLLPGPLAYAQQDDVLLIASSSFELRCYQFTDVASRLSRDSCQAGFDTTRGEFVVRQHWRLCIGEPVLQILPVSNNSADTRESARGKQSFDINPCNDVIVLAEKSIFVVSISGALKTQRRLDFVPTACRVLSLSLGGSIGHFGVVVADSTGSIMVFRDSQLLWTSKLPVKPVDLIVSYFPDTFGHIIALGRDAVLSISCLGTLPHDTSIRGHERNEVSYQMIDKEYGELCSDPFKRSSDAFATRAQQVEISVRFQKNTAYDVSEPTETHYESFFASSNVLTLQVSVLYSGSGTLDDVGVSIVLPHPVVAARSTYVIPSLRGGTPEIICIHLRACGIRSRASIPASNVAVIMASYCTHTIENSISTQEVQLPLSLFCVVALPMKTAKHKITIEINRSLPCLMDLFKDMIPIPQMDDVMTTTGNALGFQFHNGVNVTIVTSKTAGRFRIQSSDFNAIWLLLSEFIYRLWAHVDLQTTSSSMDAPLKISLQEPLPLQNLFEIIEEYYSTKLECDMDNINISSYAHSFRAVQKQLLFWLKSKYPVSVSHLGDLLDMIVPSFDAVSENIRKREKGFSLVRQRLAAAIQLLMNLVQHRFDMDVDQLRVLRSHIPTVSHVSLDHGWDNWTEAAISMLLSNRLLKNGATKTMDSSLFKSEAEQGSVARGRKNAGKIKKSLFAVFELLRRSSLQ